MSKIVTTTNNLATIASHTTSSSTSIIDLMLNADLVVKLVIIILIVASIRSWTIIFEKILAINDLKNKSQKFEKLFWSGQALENLYERIKGRIDHPLANIFVAAMNEWNRASMKCDYALTISLKDRIYKAMDLVVNKEINKLEDNLSFLAIVGSSATFIGLFGTVWGIMHSFQSIAAAKNTTLAVVAPGIAEALLATAIGLIAAIPAAAFYNVLVEKINNFRGQIEDFSTELGSVLSRELDNEKK